MTEVTVLGAGGGVRAEGAVPAVAGVAVATLKTLWEKTFQEEGFII